MKTGVDSGGMNVMQVTAGVAAFDGYRGRTQVLNLTGDTTISGASNFQTGEVFLLMILQDGVGGWDITWPANFKGVPGVNMAALGKTEMKWASDEQGDFYPFDNAVWS
jgi:hypothetical protein